MGIYRFRAELSPHLPGTAGQCRGSGREILGLDFRSPGRSSDLHAVPACIRLHFVRRQGTVSLPICRYGILLSRSALARHPYRRLGSPAVGADGSLRQDELTVTRFRLAQARRSALPFRMASSQDLSLRLPTAADVDAAAERLAGGAVRTPLISSPALDAFTRGRVFLQAQTLQRTGPCT